MASLPFVINTHTQMSESREGELTAELVLGSQLFTNRWKAICLFLWSAQVSDVTHLHPRAVGNALFLLLQVPKRICKFSHPGLAVHTVHEIARLRNLPVKTMMSKLRENTYRIYSV